MKKLFLILLIIMGIASASQAQEKETKVRISTSMGDIVVKLYNDTPQHRDNFLKMINEGWYNNSPFHRVIKEFMIQGGANADGRQDPGYTIPAEIRENHIHKKGALAAARLGDQVNPQKASSGCQFYIVQGKPQTARDFTNYSMYYGKKFSAEQKEIYSTLGGTPHLDGDYTVFGEVVEGLDIVDKIAAVPTTTRGGMPNVPVKSVVIMKMTVIE